MSKAKAKPERIRKTLDLPVTLSEQIDVYESDYHHTSNAQAIIQLIQLGLKYNKKIEEASLHPLYSEGNERE